ncbi:NADP-dependent oxidoreductase [Yersinia enterocolitica]|uniref:NADP-dependent oxidoreductase n=1 Tax=Yersinia enterocolitica TaxID=630 RepID=UPI001C8D0134|nr:NADP-dependent oxidoreductase [Yersinia enterocolitica]MBX9476900.1 NADP-dependent oxidoreductase [Yersinia enterocolitica]MBX9487278.1 NADP-dependent oxidoreductase [Yersinia enterocolitica]MBX9492275.1 NADP-dependent oxidoreductase [Yersinia enterocolitica]
MKNKTMKAFTFKRYGKSPALGFDNIDYPAPAADEILVKVYAVGLNPIDNMIPTGIFKPVLHFKLPATLGSDLSGVVVAVGCRVTRFTPGDEIFASIFDKGTGSLAEFALVPESAAAIKPTNLDFVQAAALPMVSLTSWQALTERAGLQPGQKVFIPAGSGGIGSFAIQLAKHLGAQVATTTSTDNVGWVSHLGADQVVDYKKQEFENELSGYDMVLGTVRGDSIEKSTQILKPGGKIVSLTGPLDAAFARARGLNVLLRLVFGLMSRKIMHLTKKRGLSYSFLFVRPDGDQLAQIGKLIEAEQIRPVVDKVFPFAEVKDALAYLAGGHAKGKVVVKIQA